MKRIEITCSEKDKEVIFEALIKSCICRFIQFFQNGDCSDCEKCIEDNIEFKVRSDG